MIRIDPMSVLDARIKGAKNGDQTGGGEVTLSVVRDIAL
jgi:hypothetical protein